jgi:hypothetical protein
MNDDGGTLSDLWREERDACMLIGRGREERGTVRVGQWGLWVIREFVSLYRGKRGDRKAVHRKAYRPANWQ